jgi:RNA polymerase sigma-70 factor, ECF subfamily
MERLAMDVMRLAGGQPGAYAEASTKGAEELIVRARRGDEEAFRLIFERYTRPIISFIFYMVNRSDLAEELAQETFVRAFRSLHSLRDEAKLSTWLFGIAKNIARESLRERHKERGRVDLTDRSVLDLRASTPSPAGQLLDKELSEVVRHALLKLDEDKRLVFTLKVYQQQSYDEIAELTGYSIPKIRNDLHRARIEMRRHLGHYLGEAR